ncbi:MAG: 5'-nucleotidase [Bacteroidetes bacterium]|nr:5'-nucleotidase [Bacteroidota bacterium]
MYVSRKFGIALVLLIAISCKPGPQQSVVQYQGYQVNKQAPVDSSLIRLIAPYGNQLKSTMGKVVGISEKGLYKKQPESEIGNFMADAMKEMAEVKFGKKVVAAFVNYGGVRSYIAKGNVTVGQIYELMPFDNLVVLQEISGSVMQQFLDKTAVDGGWPLSGLTMEIKDKKAVHVMIAGKPLDVNAKYLIANSDYVANGGSDCSMLKGIAQENRGYLLRDALLDYSIANTAKGKTIDSNLENRVVNAN